MSFLEKLEALCEQLPEWERVDIEAWDDHPSFRVRGKNFVFANHEGTSLGLKLSKEEAAAVVASDDRVEPMGYGLGRHGWISVSLPDGEEPDWEEIEEWVRTSYTMVAPKTLARVVLDQDSASE